MIAGIRTVVEFFDLGDIDLQKGGMLPDAKLGYATFGELSENKDNVVVMPTYYTGTHADNARLIGSGRALDSDRFFIVVPNMFGNGVSTSPSTATAGANGADFPHITPYDNVACQQRLLHERWGIERIRLVLGWSMGAQQSYQWAAQFPPMVQAILPICGSAKTSIHNSVFLDGVKAALMADGEFQGGRYCRPPKRGLKAFGRVYAGWAYSQAFFRQHLYRELGCVSAAEVLLMWERDHLCWDANDLLAMLSTWQHADISDNPIYHGDYNASLGAISARAVVMPCRTDLYFPPEDSAFEVAHMSNAELRVIESDWGHMAGSPNKLPAVTGEIETVVSSLLEA